MRSIPDRRVTPLAGLAVAVFAASTSAILVRWSGAPSTVAAFYRVLFTTLLVAPIAVWFHREEFARLSRRNLGLATLAGVALAIHFGTWFESLDHTSVAASVTLVQLQPVFVVLGAGLVLGERITRRTVAAIGVAIAGAAVMSFGDAGQAPLADSTAFGNGLALVGAMTLAGYVLAGRSIRQRVSLFPYVTVVYAACAISLFAVVGVQGHAFVAYPPTEWLLFLAMALVPGILGHTLINWTLEHVESVVVSVAWLGEPLGATLLAFGLLGEVPDAITLAGGVLVLGGIFATTRTRDHDG